MADESSTPKSNPPNWNELAKPAANGASHPSSADVSGLPGSAGVGGHWPHKAPDDMQAYGFVCPNTGARMVAMTEHTWTAQGTVMEQLRRMAREQDARIKELVGQVAEQQHLRLDAETRLNNIRDVRRAEKRAELEQGGFILPGDSRFTKGK